MYSESDIESAVAAGALTQEAAASFRAHVEAKRRAPSADEEHFRLLTSFNDIFITLAIALVMVVPFAMTSGTAVALIAWGIAEFVTRVRRMALPSIVLLLLFAGGVFFEAREHAGEVVGERGPVAEGMQHALAALVALAATFAHWWRFRVAMTPALWAGLLLVALAFTADAVAAGGGDAIWAVLGLGGLATFAYAMHWDLADRERKTQRADVAFWLHLLSAPLIAHSLFRQIGVFEADAAVWAGPVLIIYALFAAVALAVDRRAILVSGLGYALYAVATLVEPRGGDGIIAASLLLGVTLLMLGIFWPGVRAATVIYLPPGLRQKLPPLQREPHRHSASRH